MFPSHKDEYTVDMEGFGALAQELAQRGDYEGAQAVGLMAAAVMQDVVANGGVGAGGMPIPPRDLMGEPRTDLERFAGMYGDPAQQGDTPRNLYAARRCDGYLVVGATWGDASPWHLRSTSDVAFEAELFGGRMIHVTFQMAPDGSPRSLTHDVEGLASPLQHVGPVPEDWVPGGCVPPPIR